MKKWGLHVSAVGLLLLALLMLALASPAVARRHHHERTEKATYVLPSIGVSARDQEALCHPVVGLGCENWAIDPLTEDFVEVEIVDALGRPVHATLEEDIDGDGGLATGETEILHHFCGATKKPIRLARETVAVAVSLWADPCRNGTPSVVTKGEITITFSSRP